VINPLFSFLYSENQDIKWAAITAMGAVTAKLADEDLESARVIMRRLMWNLNDESGGIGWGSPEAMGEILACNEILANDYATILISYARENGNFQEHVLMQRGVLWGLGRVSQVRAHLVKGAAPHLLLYLGSRDPTIRGLTAWIMGLLEAEDARKGLKQLTEDEAELQIFIDRILTSHQVKDLAKESLSRLPSRVQ
jgi:HEAT repeat protein